MLDLAEGIAEHYKVKLSGDLLQAREVAAALVDEAIELQADAIIVGLPYRKRFGGDFAIGDDHPVRLPERAVPGHRRARAGAAAGERRANRPQAGAWQRRRAGHEPGAAAAHAGSHRRLRPSRRRARRAPGADGHDVTIIDN